MTDAAVTGVAYLKNECRTALFLLVGLIAYDVCIGTM